MSSRFRSVYFFDASGAPLTGLSVGGMISQYRTRTGSAITPVPTVVNLGAGGYGFEASLSDEATGVVAVLDGGASAVPRYQIREVAQDGLLAWLYTDAAGALFAGGGSPSFTHYDNPSGAPVTPPSIPAAIVGAYLYALTVPPADVVTGISLRIDSPVNAYPSRLTATVFQHYSSGPGPTPPSPSEPPIIYSQTYFADGKANPDGRDLAWDRGTKRFKRSARGGLVLTQGSDAVRQAVERKLTLLFGEWFLDVTKGFPLLQQVLVKSPRLAAIREVFRDHILAVPGVATVTSLDLEFDRRNRKLSVHFQATTDLGEIFSGNLTR